MGLSSINETGSSYIYGNTSTPLPLRWSAPEVFTQRKFSEWSDVWSFGVTVWEIFQFGGIPYWEKDRNEDVMKYVFEGGRLSRPSLCPNEVWTTIEKCFITKPSQRLNFKSVVEELLHYVTKEGNKKEDCDLKEVLNVEGAYVDDGLN